MGDTFTNPYPAEYGYYRIGTPINADLNRAAPACPAFVMSALQAENCLLIDSNPTTTKRIQGGGTDDKTQDAMGFSADTSLKLGFFVNASLSAHVARSRNHCFSNSVLTVTAYAKQESGITLRRNVPSDMLLKCATDDFRAKVVAIRKAVLAYVANPSDAGLRGELTKAYKSFYATYGTGFVSKLSLGAIGMFRGTAKYDSDSDETKANYGGGCSISGIHGGFSAAAEYTSKKLTTHAGGTFEAEAFGMPAGSGVASWAEGFVNEFAGKQLDKLSDAKAWQESFEANVAKADEPVIKERPSKAAVPSFAAGDIEQQLADIKLNEYVDAWRDKHGGQEPSATQYEEWIGKLKAVAADVDVRDVAHAKVDLKMDSGGKNDPSKEHHGAERLAAGDAAKAVIEKQPPPVNEEKKESRAPIAASLMAPDQHMASFGRIRRTMPELHGTVFLIARNTPEALGGGETHALPAVKAEDANIDSSFLESPKYASDPENGSDTVDFGGYGVVGYEYTAWADAFPELKPIAKAPTTSQLSMGLAMAWLSIHETLAQYLRFCARTFPDIAPEGTSSAANAFRMAVTDMGDYIVQSFVRPDAEVLTLPKLYEQFHLRLRARRFALVSHYELLLENYEWLRRVPFGAVPFVELKDYYYFQPYTTAFANGKVVHRNGSIRKTEFPAASFMEKGALRLYPVIHESAEGKIYFHWTNVEFVTVGGQEHRVSAGLLRPLNLNLNTDLDWGMFRIGYDPRAAMMAEAVTPDLSGVLKPSDAVWSLAETSVPKCYAWVLKKDAPSLGFDVAQSSPGPLIAGYRLSVVGLGAPDSTCLKMIVKREGEAIVGLDVSLAPVDYSDAKIAEEPANGFVGGGAMWIEPRTDRILDALHQLAA